MVVKFIVCRGVRMLAGLEYSSRMGKAQSRVAVQPAILVAFRACAFALAPSLDVTALASGPETDLNIPATMSDAPSHGRRRSRSPGMNRRGNHE